MENYKSFNSPELQAIINKYSHFFHETRRRLYLTLVVFISATILGVAFNEKIIKILVDLLSLRGINIVFTSPFQFINLALTCGLVTGIVVVIPFLTLQILHFLKPALKIREFKIITRFLPFTLLLFLFGFAFGALIMKWQIEIFLERSIALGIGNVLDISGLLTTVFLTSALLGIGFQFPIALLLLLRLGIIQHQSLSKKRMWVYLGSLIFAFLLPPDSIIADIFLALPLIILFEITLLLNKLFERKKIHSDI